MTTFHLQSLLHSYTLITSMPMFATYRVKLEVIISEVLNGSSVRIKGVKTLYVSGAGTFPQFSAGH